MNQATDGARASTDRSAPRAAERSDKARSTSARVSDVTMLARYQRAAEKSRATLTRDEITRNLRE